MNQENSQVADDQQVATTGTPPVDHIAQANLEYMVAEAMSQGDKEMAAQVASESGPPVPRKASVKVSGSNLGSPGERSVFMLMSRRTGLPVLSQAICLDSEPIHLVDAVVPVVAIRGKRKVTSKSDIRSAFNPVLLDESVFQSLIGEGETQPEYFTKLGVFSFSSLGVDRLRYSRYTDELLGTRELERAIKHIALSLLANPAVDRGVYGLTCDSGVHLTDGHTDIAQIAGVAHKAMYRGRELSRVMGMPTVTTLAMERHEEPGDIPGEKYWPISKIFHRMGDLPEGQEHFTPYNIRGIFTHMDVYRITNKSPEGAQLFNELFSSGRIIRYLMAPGNMRDFVLGKFAAGLGQLKVPTLQREMRVFLAYADKLVFDGAPPEALEKASADACHSVMQEACDHINETLAPHLIQKAIQRASKKLGKEIRIQDLAKYAIRKGPNGEKVQDPEFTMANAESIAAGVVGFKSSAGADMVKAISDDAYSWHRDALNDVLSAVSGLKAMYVNRSGERVETFLCHLDAADLRGSLDVLGTRPSFFTISGNPIQILNRGWDTYVPQSYEFYLKAS